MFTYSSEAVAIFEQYGADGWLKRDGEALEGLEEKKKGNPPHLNPLPGGERK